MDAAKKGAMSALLGGGTFSPNWDDKLPNENEATRAPYKRRKKTNPIESVHVDTRKAANVADVAGVGRGETTATAMNQDIGEQPMDLTSDIGNTKRPEGAEDDNRSKQECNEQKNSERGSTEQRDGRKDTESEISSLVSVIG